MDEILKNVLGDLVEEMKKDLPKATVEELEELASLKARVQMSMMKCRLVDTGMIKRINELTRKHYYHDEQGKKDPVVGTLDFGEAIQRLKNGARMARSGWNGKGMFVTFCPAGGVDYTFSDGMNVTRRDYLYMKAADDTVVPWVASQTDILACDWYEVEKKDTNDG